MSICLEKNQFSKILEKKAENVKNENIKVYKTYKFNEILYSYKISNKTMKITIH